MYKMEIEIVALNFILVGRFQYNMRDRYRVRGKVFHGPPILKSGGQRTNLLS